MVVTDGCVVVGGDGVVVATTVGVVAAVDKKTHRSVTLAIAAVCHVRSLDTVQLYKLANVEFRLFSSRCCRTTMTVTSRRLSVCVSKTKHKTQHTEHKTRNKRVSVVRECRASASAVFEWSVVRSLTQATSVDFHLRSPTSYPPPNTTTSPNSAHTTH